jgi:hypothetical protein
MIPGSTKNPVIPSEVEEPAVRLQRPELLEAEAEVEPV